MPDPVVAIFRLGSIGDAVVALPCLRAIAEAYPRARRILITNGLESARASSAESVIGPLDLVHEVIYYPVAGHTVRKFWRLWRDLRRLRARTLVYLQPRPGLVPVLRDLAFFRSAGVRRIVGAPLKSELRRNRVDEASGDLEFEVERLARTMLPSIPVDLSAARLTLDIRPDEADCARRHLGSPVPTDLIAIAAGAKIAAKDWGEGNWRSLIEQLSARKPDATLVFVGAADERALAERLVTAWRGRALNLCGVMTPRQTAAVFQHCRLLVCHDSGPMHLAAAQCTPCVALFGNYNAPRTWFPYGTGHRVIYEPEGIGRISVGRVIGELVATLSNPQRAESIRCMARPDGMQSGATA